MGRMYDIEYLTGYEELKTVRIIGKDENDAGLVFNRQMEGSGESIVSIESISEIKKVIERDRTHKSYYEDDDDY